MTDRFYKKLFTILTCIIMIGSSALATEAETPVEAEPVACAHASTLTREEAGKTATCTENGSHVMITVCADCGAELSRQTMTDLALGHEYTETGRKQPTCTEAGSVTYTCLRCGNSYTEASGAAAGHAFQETGRKAPTCTEGGNITYTCSQCGLSYTEACGDPSGHDYRETGRQEATLEQEGLITYTCTRCGDVRTERIPKTVPTAPSLAEPEPVGNDPTTPPQSTENQTGSVSSGSGETPETNDPTPTPGDAPAEPVETANSDETGTDGNGDQPVTAPQNDAPEQAGGETGSTEITDPEEQKTENTEETPDEKEDHPETKEEDKKDTEEKKEEIIPEEPFEQQESVDGILITVTAEPGVLEANTRLTIRKESSRDFTEAVEKVLGADKVGASKVYHQLISISGAAVNGEVQITMEGLGFREILIACPEGSLVAHVMRHNPDGGSAGTKVVFVPARISMEENRASFQTNVLGVFDIATVMTMPETWDQEKTKEEEKSFAEEEKTLEEEPDPEQDVKDEEPALNSGDPDKLEELENKETREAEILEDRAGPEANTEEGMEAAGTEEAIRSIATSTVSAEMNTESGTHENKAGVSGTEPETIEKMPEQANEETKEETSEDTQDGRMPEDSTQIEILEVIETVLQESFSVELTGDNSEAVENYIRRKLPGYNSSVKMKARSTAGAQVAGSKLSGVNKFLYDALATRIVRVAEGSLESTVFTVNAEELRTEYWSETDLGCAILNNKLKITDNAMSTYLQEIGYDKYAVFKALISDYPYDLYWAEHGVDFVGEESFIEDPQDGEDRIRLNEVTVKIPVSTAYQDGGTYQFNTDLPARVNGAASRINRITETYANRSMFEKVTGFKQEICNLAAPETTSSGQQDSEVWQLVYVFDGDPETKVTSEGYAKAFKYLCDLSGITCITMSGTVDFGNGGTSQMWNVVKMDDNVLYLADVYNSDTGEPGFPDKLFLKGCNGSKGVYTVILAGNTQITYTANGSAYSKEWINNWASTEYGTTVAAHAVEISDCEHGRVEATPSLAEAGTTVQLTILPDAGYELDSWSVTNKNTQSPVNPAEGTGYSFVMPDADVTVAAVFRQIAAPQFTNHSLVLTGMVGVDFYLTLPEGKARTDYDGAYVTFSGNKISSTAQHPLSEAPVVSGMYKFTAFITSIQMADLITPTLHYTENGEEKTVMGTPYSAEDYIRWAASDGSLTTRQTRIVKALADYGYYAQRFLSTQNGWALGSDYAEMSTHFTDSYDESSIKQAAAASAFSRTANSQIVETVQYRMNMGSQITLTVRMAPKEGQTIENVMLNGTAAETTVSGVYTMVSVPNILATRLADTSTIIAGDCEIQVSPMSYVYDVLSKSGSAQRIRTFMCALYQYGQACN